MAIAGFAVGGNTPLHLTVPSALRKGLGPSGLPTEENAKGIPQFVEVELEDALTGVAATCDPSSSPQTLSFIATFARLDNNQVPILQQLQLTETWTPMGPLHMLAPKYKSTLSREVPITQFYALPVGISFVADGILHGVYKSDDPTIQSYYRRRKTRQLDDMPLDEMSALALVILRETKKLTDYVGGGDQIGEFPANGNATFRLPDTLPTETQLTAKLMRWEGLGCTKTQTPPCGNVPLSFSLDSAHPLREPFTKFLMASEFKDISVALDNNLLIADSFDGVTLKWHGGPFFSYRNTFKNCVLELSPEAQDSRYPELAACRLERKAVINLTPDTVGLPMETAPTPHGLLVLLPRDLRP